MNDKEKWVLDYLDRNNGIGADVLDQQFSNGFIAKFPKLKIVPKTWGALYCPTLSRTLINLYKKGYLSRFRIGLGLNWQPGFPKWVYSYELTKLGQMITDLQRKAGIIR